MRGVSADLRGVSADSRRGRCGFAGRSVRVCGRVSADLRGRVSADLRGAEELQCGEWVGWQRELAKAQCGFTVAKNLVFVLHLWG